MPLLSNLEMVLAVFSSGALVPWLILALWRKKQTEYRMRAGNTL